MSTVLSTITIDLWRKIDLTILSFLTHKHGIFHIQLHLWFSCQCFIECSIQILYIFCWIYPWIVHFFILLQWYFIFNFLLFVTSNSVKLHFSNFLYVLWGFLQRQLCKTKTTFVFSCLVFMYCFPHLLHTPGPPDVDQKTLFAGCLKIILNGCWILLILFYLIYYYDV